MNVRIVALAASLSLGVAAPVWAHESGAGADLLWDATWHRVENWLVPLNLWSQTPRPAPADRSDIFYDYEMLKEYVVSYGLTAAVEQLDALAARYGNCHQVAHKAGQFAWELKGPAVLQVHTTLCHSGGMHGVTEAFFRERGTADVDYLLNTVCFELGGRVLISECLHGMGHGLMAWVSYELLDALDYCDRLRDLDWLPSCYGGVFMENVLGGLATEVGHTSRYVSATDLHYPCTIVEDRYTTVCYYHQPSRMMFMIGHDFPAIAQACNEAPASAHVACYQGIGKELPWHFDYDAEAIVDTCVLAPSAELRTLCTYEAIKAMFADGLSREPLAHGVCLALPSDQRHACEQFVVDWRQYVTNNTAVPGRVMPTLPPRALPATPAPSMIVMIYPDRSRPAQVEISRGQTVIFHNRSGRPVWPASNIHPTHRIYPDSDVTLCGTARAGRMFDACAAVVPGESYSFRFDHIGIWYWHDHLSPLVTGTVYVGH